MVHIEKLLQLASEQSAFSGLIYKRLMIAPVRQALPTPTGWLISPTKDFVLFFIRDPKSRMSFPDVMTQLWYCTIEGIPTQLKNTRRLDLESANETWTELITNGWALVEHQINDDAA